MKNVMKVLKTALIGLAFILPATAPALDRETAKKVFKEKEKAIVTLEVVMEMRSASYGDENERRVTSTATVVHENGLAVTALSSLDPGYIYAKMSGEEDMVTRLKSLKYILHDNTEVNAAVVLRDPDLDIVFLRPVETEETKELTYTFIDLNDNTTAEPLDPAFTISRMGRIGRRAALGMAGEIQAAVRGPRTFYIPSAELVSNRTGSPIFANDGKVIGIVAIYVFPGGQRALGEEDEPYSYAVIPASEIAKNLEQAMEAEAVPIVAEEGDDEASDEEAGEAEETEETEETENTEDTEVEATM